MSYGHFLIFPCNRTIAPKKAQIGHFWGRRNIWSVFQEDMLKSNLADMVGYWGKFMLQGDIKFKTAFIQSEKTHAEAIKSFIITVVPPIGQIGNSAAKWLAADMS